MTFATLSRVSLAVSGLLMAGSVVLFLYPGPTFSIEFTGGTLMELQLPAGKARSDLTDALRSYEEESGQSLGNFAVSAIKTATEEAFLLRLRPMENEEHVQMLAHIEERLGAVKELQYTTIGPSLSQSLKTKSLKALTIASVAVIAYLGFAFRKLPRKMKPWKFGVLAVLAFIHDVIITTGVFVVLGFFTSFEFDPLFVTALLTILAYSANDTIVIFDRIRTNLSYDNRNEDLNTVIARSLRECVTRTFGTTMSTLIMLFALFFLGSESIRWFILALIFGIGIGAYSSYFVAAPLLMYWK